MRGKKMFKKLKGIFRPKKEKREKSAKIKSSSFLIPFLFFLLGIRLFFQAKKTSVFFLCARLGLFLLLLEFGFSPGKEKAVNKSDIVVYQDFYRRWFFYAALENSYLLGFQKAVDASPVSLLRDKLRDFLEGERTSLLPLSLRNNQVETRLIRSRKERLSEEFEYTYADCKEREKLFRRLFPAKEAKPFPIFLLPLVFSLVMVICLFYGFAQPI